MEYPYSKTAESGSTRNEREEFIAVRQIRAARQTEVGRLQAKSTARKITEERSTIGREGRTEYVRIGSQMWQSANCLRVS